MKPRKKINHINGFKKNKGENKKINQRANKNF